MTRDLRDPQKMGEWYLKLRANGMPIEEAVQVGVGRYENGPWMSANPKHHHMTDFFSSLPEDIGDLSDGA